MQVFKLIVVISMLLWTMILLAHRDQVVNEAIWSTLLIGWGLALGFITVDSGW